jgi:hypothetical protein
MTSVRPNRRPTVPDSLMRELAIVTDASIGIGYELACLCAERGLT